jgi:WD40-like Beta Propeller Repeat
VNPTEQNTKTPRNTGIFATLRALFHIRGSGATKTGRRLVLPVFAAVLGVLAFAAAPTLAAAPETPETGKASAIMATTATLEDGVLNPKARGEVGEYEYRFRVSATECEGESSTAPEAAAGNEKEAVPPVDLTNLQPNAHYTFCLVEHNLAGEYSLPSPPEHFTTKAVPPTVAGASASVTSNVATFDAQVNPNNEAMSYVFEYSKTEAAGKLTGTIVKVDGASPLESFGEQTASVSTGAILTAGTTYYYRVVAENAQSKVEGKPVVFPVGSVQSFTTVPTPHTEAPSTIGTSTATFNGKLTLDSIETQYSFDYNLGGECINGSNTTPTEASTGSVSSAVTELQPNQKYTVCLVTSNVFGSEVGNAVTFETKPAAATIDSYSASNIKSSEATLEGTVNPNNQVTECHFLYVDQEEFLKTGFSKAAEVACSPELLKGYGEQSVSPTKLEKEAQVPAPIGGLTPGTEYKYRIFTKNGKGEESTVVAKAFKTAEEPEKQAAEPIAARTETLKGVLNPHNEFEAGSYEFTYEQSETECIGAEETNSKGEPDGQFPYKTAPVPAEASAGHTPEAEHAEITGLQPGAVYTFCLLERNAAGQEAAISAPETFTAQIAAPAITAEQVTHITETGATLQANINPNGAGTTYHFEYDTTPYTSSAPHGTSVTETGEAEVSIGQGTSPVSVTVQLKSLTPGATYYYRVVTSNSQGPAEGNQGPGKAFTTAAPQATNSKECTNEQRRAEQPYGLELPDCRAYEMVSPLATNGQDATDSFVEEGPRASVNGEKITYTSRGSFAEPAGETKENQFLSRRNEKEGRWETQSVTPLHETLITEPHGSYEATAFTPNLEEAIVETNAPLTAGAPVTKEPTSGTREDGLYVADFATGSYQYVTTEGDAEPMGTSTDLSHVAFGQFGAVSEWWNGKVLPVSVAPDGDSMEASVGAQFYTDSSTKDREAWHAVSADGSRVYLTSPGDAEPRLGEHVPGSLYVRVNAEHEQSKLGPGGECVQPAEACTIEVASAGTSGVRYWGASADGTKAFFTEEGDLYQYELPVGATTGTTTAIAAGAEVQGVVQISEAGSYVYFVANGVLPGAEKNAQGEAAKVGTCIAKEDSIEGLSCNLYVWHEGKSEFIDTLVEGDEVGFDEFVGGDKSDWHNGNEPPLAAASEVEGGPAANTAVVSPDGKRLAFVSERGLPTANFPTGYDNEEAEQGECESKINSHAAESGKCREVYLYDAETGGLVCASCDSSGARPTGPSSLSQPRFQLAEYRPRNLLEDGTLFFNSSDALVPHASDGHQNVYEFQDGHVYSISNVAGGNESFFLDASSYVNAKGEEVEGGNVFFGSADQLLPEDTGNNVVVWDARVGGGFPVKVAAPPCTTAEACRTVSAPTPSVFGTPATATFSGPGNTTPAVPAVVTPKKKTAAELKAEKLAKALKQCAKDKQKAKRAKCQKQAKQKYGTKKSANKATNDRRGK